MTTSANSSPTSATAGAGLSNLQLATYAVPAGFVGMMYTVIVIAFAKYATDVLLVSGSVAGAILLGSRIWDAISDPAVGYLSDVTKSRLGRRKSWILVSALPLVLFSTMLWAPPEEVTGAVQAAWLTVAVFGFYTAYTAFEVPHIALGAELSFDAHDRNRMFGARQLAKTAIGLLLASWLGSMILESDGSERRVALFMNLGMTAFVVASVVFLVARLPREPQEHVGRGASNPFKAVRDVLRNRYARIVLFTYLVESFGMGGVGVLVPYVVEYVMFRPDLMYEMLAVHIFSGVAAIPIWIRLARHFEKRRLWLFSMGQACVGFGMLVFLGENSWPLMAVSSFTSGSAGSCGAVLGVSLKAEVIDYDEYLTGERKEGSYFAAWAFVQKLASGLMIGLVLFTLDAVGYVPNEPQTESVKNWMIFLMGGMPIIGYLLGIAVFRHFDLTEAEHARIRRVVEGRKSA